MRLKNKVAVITGAASGVGKTVVDLFIQEGAHVVGVDLKEGRWRRKLYAAVVSDSPIRLPRRFSSWLDYRHLWGNSCATSSFCRNAPSTQ